MVGIFVPFVESLQSVQLQQVVKIAPIPKYSLHRYFFYLVIVLEIGIVRYGTIKYLSVLVFET